MRQLIFKLLLCGLILTLPSNLFYTFFSSDAYVNGVRVDYLIPKLYGFDFFLIPLGIIGLYSLVKSYNFRLKKCLNLFNLCFLTVAILFILSQFNTANTTASLYFLTRITLIIGLFYTMRKLSVQSFNRYLAQSILLSLALQTILATYQYFFQQPFLPYYFLGETNIQAYSGIAKGKSIFNASEYILSYGTLSHPNILAGFGVLSFLAFFRLNRGKKGLKMILAIVSVGLLMIMTLSISALLGFITLLLTIFMLNKRNMLQNQKKLLTIWIIVIVISTPLLLSRLAQSFLDQTSINRRSYLNSAALDMFMAHPITGVGLNNFTVHVEDFASDREVVRFVQPVHNIFLLWLAETGVVGVLLLGSSGWFLIIKMNEKEQAQALKIFNVLLPLLILDHYLLTAPGMLVLTAIIAAKSS